MAKSFEETEVWQKVRELVKFIFKAESKTFRGEA